MRAAWALWWAAAVALLVVPFLAPFNVVADDTLFYAVVAEHLLDGEGVTFNGAVATNGVQPLWQAVVTGWSAVVRSLGIEGDAATLRTLYVPVLTLTLLALGLTDRLLRQWRIGAAGRMIGMTGVLVYLAGPFGHHLSEAHLATVLLIVAMGLVGRVIGQDRAAAARTAIVAGVVLGLLFLARLDLVYVVAALLGAVAWCRRDPVVLRAAVPAAVVAAPYLLWNLFRFGHLLPVSGALKVDITNPRFLVGAVGATGLGLLTIAAVGGALGWSSARWAPPARATWTAVAAGAAASSLFYFVAGQGTFTTWNWYYVPHAVAAATGVAVAADSLVARDRRAVPAIGVGLAAIVVLSFAVLGARAVGESDRVWSAGRAFAGSLAEEVPPGELVATVDLPGVLAFSGEREVLSMDGLTADFDFQDDLVDRGAACVLSELGVEHLVTYADAGPGEIEFTSWLHRRSAGSVTLDPDDRLLAGSDPAMVLWRIEPEC